MARGKDTKTAAEERRARLGEALRANLGRRKSQGRARSEAPAPAADDKKKAKGDET
jgi:hypothetical protein